LLGQKPPKQALDELARDWQRNLRRAGVGKSWPRDGVGCGLRLPSMGRRVGAGPIHRGLRSI